MMLKDDPLLNGVELFISFKSTGTERRKKHSVSSSGTSGAQEQEREKAHDIESSAIHDQYEKVSV
jgi:hypothetical protein